LGHLKLIELDIHVFLLSFFSFFFQLNAFNATLFESYNRKVEMQQVLNKTQDLMGSVVLPLEQRLVGVGE
jgi:hypothetical protein